MGLMRNLPLILRGVGPRCEIRLLSDECAASQIGISTHIVGIFNGDCGQSDCILFQVDAQ